LRSVADVVDCTVQRILVVIDLHRQRDSLGESLLAAMHARIDCDFERSERLQRQRT
jgi:hypothetical protein